MTTLSRSAVNPAMVTVQCDLCLLPLMITNHEDVIAALGWKLVARGSEDDVCPPCQEARGSRTRLSLRRSGVEPHKPDGRLPNLLIIGAAKSGTTGMHAYLNQHPDVALAEWKELRFFSDPDHLEWIDTYKDQFASSASIVGESSTMYTRAPAVPGVADRVANLVPDAKLIYMVRDPVARAVASYVEERFHGLEPRTLEQAFADYDDPYNPYVAASRYAEQLTPFLSHFPRDQVLVLPLGDLEKDPDGTVRRAFEFIGVDPDAEVDTSERINDRATKVEYVGTVARLRRSGAGRVVRRLPPWAKAAVSGPARRTLTRPIGRPEVSPELRARLEAVLAEDAAAFRELTNLELSDWSV